MGKVRIELQEICKSYFADASVTQALRKISLRFGQGEFVAITGESGSGKSTLLRMIGGLDSFDEGEMLVDGQPTFSFGPEDWEEFRRDHIGYVFQDYSLIGHYTALDNMMSALLIMGKTPSEAKTIGEHYLKQVGLLEFAQHPATELSSGQKQRLSIARALAKNTGIILADEPTGNLDSETGEQIMQLLKELSQNRLIIMVTHNYSQAAPYVTRRIHMHDGMVISDTAENASSHTGLSSADDFFSSASLLDELHAHGAEAASDEISPDIAERQAAIEILTGESGGPIFQWFRRFARQLKTASIFARTNRKTQLGRGILFTIFLFFISTVSFLLIGELHSHGDDIFTKSYSKDAFAKEDSTRLVVKHADGSSITQEDVDAIGDLSYVSAVDSCDLANDVNFYLMENRDYTIVFGMAQRGGTGAPRVNFVNTDHFVMSEDAISESDLSAGTLPESRTDLVIYGEDESLLGSEMTCYFTSTNIWGKDQYYTTTFTICGLLKENTEQAYFSKDFCRMLTMHVDSGTYRLCYNYDFSKGEYQDTPAVIPVISDDLTGNEVRISQKLSGPAAGIWPLRFQDVDADNNASGDLVETEVQLLEETNESTAKFMEVSQEFYDTYYHKTSLQASVYLKSYAKTDTAIRKLEKMGYVAISTFRMSTTDYISDQVNQRLIIIGICSLGLILLLLGELLILRALMRIRVKDYDVLHFIGMRMPMISTITYLEMSFYTVLAMVLTAVLALGMWAFGVPVIAPLMWYYSFAAVLEFVFYNLLLMALTVLLFNHSLKGRLSL